MSSEKNKAAAAALAALMCLSAAGCGEDTLYIGSYGGKDIPSGIYIYYLQNAYYEAQSKMTENDTDVFSITIDDKNGRDWIISEAKDKLKEYVAVESKFDEYGLSLTEEETAAAKINIESLWEYYGKVMEGYGIAQSSCLKVYLNSLKSEKLFDKVYGEDGEQAVPDSEIKAYMTDSYAMINYIAIELKDGEGNLLKSDGKAERMEMAKDYVERAKNGEDMDVLNMEYQDFCSALAAEAQPETDAAESEYPELEFEDEGGGIITDFIEVEPSDAEEMAPVETENSTEDDISEETTEPESENVSEADETENETAVTDDTETAETSVPETEEEMSDVTFADISDLMGDTDPYDDYDFPTYTSNKQVIEKNGSFPDKAVVDKVFNEMQTGDITIIESTDSEFYYVVYKMDLLENDDYFITAKDSLLNEMKKDDYSDLLKGWADSSGLSINQKSVDRYQPDKFAEEEKNQ